MARCPRKTEWCWWLGGFPAELSGFAGAQHCMQSRGSRAPPSHSGLHHLSHHNNRNQTLAFKLRIWLWFHLWGCRYDVKMSWNVCTGRLYLESSLGGRTKYHFCWNQWEFWMAVPLCGHPAPNGELLGRVKVSWCGLLCSPGEWSSFFDFKNWPKMS